MRASANLMLAALALLISTSGGLRAQSSGSELESFGLTGEEHSQYDVAAREAYSHNNSYYDPNVDLATPQGSPPPEYQPSWIAPPCESPWAHLGLYGNGFYWIYGGPQYFSPPPPGPPPAGAKSGMLQRVTLTETWLAGGNGRDEMGVNDLEVKATLALPVSWLATPLILTPGFGVHHFNGPEVTDVPGQTYDTYLDIRWMRQVSPRVGIDLAVTPGWYSDYEQSDSDALRIGARGVALITLSPAFQIALGAAYLDRDDVPVLPLGGVIWIPNADTKVELILPRPKISRRFEQCCHHSHWMYLAGEFGGGSWAIERANGRDDVLNYRDYRFIVGVERVSVCGVSGRVEVGYVFGREIEYDSRNRDFDLDSTMLVRGELSY